MCISQAHNAVSSSTANIIEATPWYFDSGASNHITNNIQHLTNPQPATVNDGIIVGNGAQLQESHTSKGQEFTPSLVQRSLPQGALSHSDLLRTFQTSKYIHCLCKHFFTY